MGSPTSESRQAEMHFASSHEVVWQAGERGVMLTPFVISNGLSTYLDNENQICSDQYSHTNQRIDR